MKQNKNSTPFDLDRFHLEIVFETEKTNLVARVAQLSDGMFYAYAYNTQTGQVSWKHSNEYGHHNPFGIAYVGQKFATLEAAKAEVLRFYN